MAYFSAILYMEALDRLCVRLSMYLVVTVIKPSTGLCCSATAQLSEPRNKNTNTEKKHLFFLNTENEGADS